MKYLVTFAAIFFAAFLASADNSQAPVVNYSQEVSEDQLNVEAGLVEGIDEQVDAEDVDLLNSETADDLEEWEDIIYSETPLFVGLYTLSGVFKGESVDQVDSGLYVQKVVTNVGSYSQLVLVKK
ncbi:MAG: hypothetical protein HUJ98_04275 [Bacteroidaceae bacterium]|nr:hypothetical protein [Bacteroidaceae bacterium]